MEARLKERKKKGGGGGRIYICYYLFRSQLEFRQWSGNFRKRQCPRTKPTFWAQPDTCLIWEHVICTDMGTSEPAFSVLLVQLDGTSYCQGWTKLGSQAFSYKLPWYDKLPQKSPLPASFSLMACYQQEGLVQELGPEITHFCWRRNRLNEVSSEVTISIKCT